MSSAPDIVYLDYAATTPVEPRVVEHMTQYMTSDGVFANPSAIHVAGRLASEVVDTSANQVAALLNGDPARLIWTSGATEANNLAILGAARQRAHRGKHLVTMQTEHKAVTDVFRHLEKSGFDVTWLSPRTDGLLDIGELAVSIRDETQLVSIMHVNNETGVMQDIASIGELCRERGVLYHVDAAQAVGKLPFDVTALPVDLVSLTAHKMYGPKGIGALYMADRPDVQIEPLIYGGGQQRRLRPGTLPVHLIAGFGFAAEMAAASIDDDLRKTRQLRERLWQGLCKVPGVELNGHESQHYPGILNVGVDDIEGESLLLALEPLCVATGSACNSRNQEPSYVLRALGRSDHEAQSAIRFSFGRMTTESDIDIAIERYGSAVARLRSIAPGRAA